MAATKEQFEGLKRNLELLNRDAAVLKSKKEQRDKRKEELEKILTEAGIDISKPKEELARLEKELQDNYDEAERQVNKFALELKEYSDLESGNKVIPLTPTITEAKPAVSTSVVTDMKDIQTTPTKPASSQSDDIELD